MKTSVLLLASLLLVGLLATACSPATVDQDALKTEVAATIYAEQTTQARPVTDTVPPAATPTPGAEDTSTPTSTATPTRSPISTPTTTPEPTNTLTPSPCLPDAAFVVDVTVPDGTNFPPGESFTKTWRILSSGCAPWPTGSTWVFDSGDQMGAPESVPVPDTPLDGTADISVDMVAPDLPGTYKSFWQMQGPSGALFGSPVFVMIVVPGPTPTPQACPPNPALVEVINELSTQLTVEVTGPQNVTFVLPASSTRRYCTLPGEYAFTGRAAGYNPLTGTKTFDSDACQCWWFYSGVKLHPDCNCENDPAQYVPLP
jgi:hypothetical protein